MVDNSDIPLWGSLLGDYFHVVRTIARMEAVFDASELERNETYQGLLEGRQELREQLDATSRRYADSDFKVALDAAFADVRGEPE